MTVRGVLENGGSATMADSYEGMWLELEAQTALINCLTLDQLLVVLEYDKPLKGFDASKMTLWDFLAGGDDG